MRAGKERTRHERVMELTARRIGRGQRTGIMRVDLEDERLDDATITMGGKRVVDFASCSYLGLNRDPRLVDAAIDGIHRFGVSHSSSTAYTSLPLYKELREGLREMMGVPVGVAASTTLGHLSALPVLIGPEDVAIVDAQAHASVHLALQVVRASGTEIVTVPHNDMDTLVEVIEAHHDVSGRVWYLADGVYSMFGDTAPVEDIVALLDRYGDLHVYFDDAHGFGWSGVAGRGVVLERVEWHPRMVVVAGLSKSFGAAGGVIATPDPERMQQIVLCGGTFTFSGPIQTAELAAGVASARIHLSDEHRRLREEFGRRIDLVRDSMIEHQLPVLSLERTPIWFLRIGTPDRVVELVHRLLDEGFYVNPASFPAVPMGLAGIRFTQTMHNDEGQIVALMEALRRHVPELVVDDATTIDLTNV